MEGFHMSFIHLSGTGHQNLSARCAAERLRKTGHEAIITNRDFDEREEW
jgi:hypothetical protein